MEMLIHLDLMFYMLKIYMDAIISAELCVLGKKYAEFCGLGKIWAEIYEIKYVMHYDSKKNLYGLNCCGLEIYMGCN